MKAGRISRMALAALAAAALSGAFPALADPVDEAPSTGDPDFVGGRRAIEAKDWPTAIRLLSSAALRDTRNADIQNYLGYAHRNAGNLPLSFKHYSRALQLDPRHRGAHEYAGEAYLIVGNLAKAEEHLSALKKICLIPCEEVEHLEKKVVQYRRTSQGSSSRQ